MPNKKNGNPTGEADGPLPLIEFAVVLGITRIILREDTIDSICTKIGNRPICIIDVCGPSRQGKSFLLGYVIRKLIGVAQGQDDWMGWSDPTKPLEGFKFQNGTTPVTEGIWVWSSPFIIQDDDGQEVAVLLVDTQGTNDEFTTNKNMAAIVGLSLLMSSVMVFNLFTNLQEDALSAFHTYIEYGGLALLEENYNGYPFQKLIYLIRDWNNPDQFKYGSKGGAKFLKQKLQPKPGQSPEATLVREKLEKCFEELDCFLMPNIGEEGKLMDFKGSVSELPPQFAKCLEEFVNDLVSPENIIIKKMLDNPITAPELKNFLETCINIFNSDQVPSAESMWQATSRMQNEKVLEKCLKSYNSHMENVIDKSPYLSSETIDGLHSDGKGKSLELFTSSKKKIGSPDLISEYQDKLINNIENRFSQIKNENEYKRDKYIQAASNEAFQQFKANMEEEFPYGAGSNTDFYDEANIREVADRKRLSVLEDFNRKLSNEKEDDLAALIQPLVKSFEGILDSIFNRNSAAMLNAIEKCTTKYKQVLKNWIASANSFEELLSFHEKAKDEFITTAPRINNQFMIEVMEKIEEIFEEGKTLFKAIQAEKTAQVQAEEQTRAAAETLAAANAAVQAAKEAEARVKAQRDAAERQRRLDEVLNLIPYFLQFGTALLTMGRGQPQPRRRR